MIQVKQQRIFESFCLLMFVYMYVVNKDGENSCTVAEESATADRRDWRFGSLVLRGRVIILVLLFLFLICHVTQTRAPGTQVETEAVWASGSDWEGVRYLGWLLDRCVLRCSSKFLQVPDLLMRQPRYTDLISGPGAQRGV